MPSCLNGQAADLIARLRAEQPAWGRLPAAMRFKQALVARLGVEAALPVARAALELPGLDTVRYHPWVPLLSAGRSEVLWSGGQPFDNPPPATIIGPSDHGPFGGVTRAAHLSLLRDALIRGRSSVILAEGGLLRDIQPGEGREIHDNPEYDTAILAADPAGAWMMEPAATAAVEEVAEAFSLVASASNDFGDCMVEHLPKLALAHLAGLPPMDVVLDASVPGTVTAAIRRIWPAGRRVHVLRAGQPLRVRRLWVASAPMFNPFYPTQWGRETWLAMATPPRAFARLAEVAARLLRWEEETEPPPAARLFLARKPERPKKRLRNRAAIEALARESGFRIVYPEDYTLPAQIAMVRRARWIMGPEGSNMLLSLYAGGGKKICWLSPPNTFPLMDLHGVLVALGSEAAILSGPVAADGHDPDWPFWSDYSVPEDAVAAFLRGWAPSE